MAPMPATSCRARFTSSRSLHPRAQITPANARRRNGTPGPPDPSLDFSKPVRSADAARFEAEHDGCPELRVNVTCARPTLESSADSCAGGQVPLSPQRARAPTQFDAVWVIARSKGRRIAVAKPERQLGRTIPQGVRSSDLSKRGLRGQAVEPVARQLKPATPDYRFRPDRRCRGIVVPPVRHGPDQH